MIRINDDWVVDIDDYNYTLKKDLHKLGKSRTDKTQMVPQYKTIGYYSTLEKALERYGEEIIKDGLRDGDRGLADACRAIREMRDEVQKLIDEVRRINS